MTAGSTSLRRRRLTPEARREMLLDTAARLVSDVGVGETTIDQIARSAGVSNQLVYNHFACRLDVLRALLLREQHRVQSAQLRAGAQARDFPDLVRRTTRVYLEHVADRGDFLRRLQSEPAVVASVEAVDHAERSEGVRYIARSLADAYGIALADAERIVDLGMGLTQAAGERLARGGATVEAVEALLLPMILGSVEAAVAALPGRD